jgi:hypothetical protein
MGGLLILVGLAGFLFGLVNLVRPLGRLRVETRGRAGLIVAGSSVVMLIGGALLPPNSETDSVSSATTVVLSTSTSTSEASSTTGQPTTTPTSSASTTSVASTTTSVSGGTLALDLLLTIPIELETPDGYDRDLFPHWSDEDGDRCDTREEVLIRDAGGTAKVGSNCAVTSGLWYSVYDGIWLDQARQLQVDHVVALKEAWDSGANQWTTFRREQFANDLDDPHALIAVSSSSNQSKGAADPSNWLPENQDDQCRYIVAWTIVKAGWELSMDESEHGRIRNLLTGPCEGATVDEGLPGRPPPPITTTTSSTPTTVIEGDAKVVIANIVYDAPGNDVEYNNSEYVVLANTGSGAADVGGWRLTDLAEHQIPIPSAYRISPGGELRIYTGPGDSTPGKYFAGFGQAIWNNSGGDTATLYDESNRTVDNYSYSS